MNHPREGLTAQISRKRKEREDFSTHTINGGGNARVKAAHPYPDATSLKQKKPSELACTNRLLAGYLAHEFLTQGSLLGNKFDPARAEAGIPLSTPAEPIKKKPTLRGLNNAGSDIIGGAEPIGWPTPKKSYAEVARILKGDGAHIPGVVNPTQLARWIQM